MFLILVLALCAIAEEKAELSTDAKIDSIFKMQQAIYAERNVNPLQNKKFGVEINPVRFFFLDYYPSFSGTFSLFNVNRHAELAFPIYWGGSSSENEIAEFDADCHYRYFLGNNQKGFYLSAFIRYAYLQGYASGNLFNQPSSIVQSENRFGMGVGLGVRIFSRKGLYWGAGVIVGRYADFGYNNLASESSLWNPLAGSNFIFEFELCQIGWAF
jgi:hypothetical protein